MQFSFFFLILLSLINLSQLTLRKESFFLYIVLFSLIFLRRYVFCRLNSQKLSVLLLVCYYEIAISGMGLWNLLIGRENSEKLISILFCSLLILYFVMGIFLRFSEKSYPIQSKIKLETSKYFVPIFLIVIAFLLSFLSSKMQITAMGVIHPQYPFKIVGILNSLRIVVLPVALYLFLYNSAFSKTSKTFLFFLAFLWLLYESYIRGSKGVVIVGVIPILIQALYEIKNKRITIYLFLFPIIFWFVYSFGYYYSNVVRGKNPVFQFVGLDGMLRRTFSEYYVGERFVPFFSDVLGLSNWKTFFKYGGTVNFHTSQIQKIDSSVYSAGITALLDGYWMLGFLGVFLTCILLTTIAGLNDNGKLPFSKFLPIYCCNILYIYSLVIWADGVWSNIFFRSPFLWLAYPLTIMFLGWLISKKYVRDLTGTTIHYDKQFDRKL